MAKRGVPVTSETVRDWRRKFGPVYAPGEQEASSVRGEMALGRSVHHDWKGASTTCGEPWARTELSSTFWCNRDPIVVQLCVSFASCDGRETISYHRNGQAAELYCGEKSDLAQRGFTVRAAISITWLRTIDEPIPCPSDPRAIKQMQRFQAPQQAQRLLSVFESIDSPFRLPGNSHLLKPGIDCCCGCFT
jgi:hypothetical protein